MISITDLSRRYGSNIAVNRISTEIRRGEIVGLLGHNGAGKTTVMKILTGYLDATSGAVTVAGLDIAEHRAEVQRKIGYLPENAPLYDDMLVQEYLVMMAELRGVAEAEIEARVAEAVVATGLNDRLLSPIGTLSKGLRQRVGIAQAIVHRPDVLVLDEPTNGLDPMQIQSIRELIVRLGKSSTIILSTHILQEVEAVCDRVLLMVKGNLVADQPLAALRATHELRLQLGAGASEVPRILSRIEGVTEVLAGANAETWRIRYHGDHPPTPAIVRAAVEAGWAVHAVVPEQRTLEMAVRELQERFMAGQEVAA